MDVFAIVSRLWSVLGIRMLNWIDQFFYFNIFKFVKDNCQPVCCSKDREERIIKDLTFSCRSKLLIRILSKIVSTPC